MAVNKNQRKSKMLHPSRTISLSFFLIIAVGTLLFMLPFMTRDGKGLPFMQALFTTTSSVCVTGLTLIDPAVTLTRYGQILLLMLIEIGGISMVTFATFFIFSIKKHSGFRSLRLAQEYTSIDTFSQVKPLVRTIIGTTVICQVIGASLLCIRFVPKMGPKGIWVSLFTAVSAYCNAGFDLFGIENSFGSLSAYNGDALVMYTVMAMIVTGGLGFYVFYDLLTYRKNRHISLHTKVVATFVVSLILVGAVCFFGFEHNNPGTIGTMTLFEKINASLFQSITSRTAGFASVDIASLHDVTKIVMMFLMFIGAGTGSTGGGIKVTTYAVLVMTVLSVIQNKNDTVIFGKRVDRRVVSKALSIALLGILVIFIVCCVLVIETPDSNGINVLFEAVSAFSTTGLSAGITATAGNPGLCSIIAAMFIGRVGPICFILALGSKESEKSREVLPEGRIMVG